MVEWRSSVLWQHYTYGSSAPQDLLTHFTMCEIGVPLSDQILFLSLLCHFQAWTMQKVTEKESGRALLIFTRGDYCGKCVCTSVY